MECECCDEFSCKNFLTHNKIARMMQTKCKEIGLNFAYYDSSEIGCGSSAFIFMSENIPKVIGKYGKDIVLVGLWTDRLLSYVMQYGTFFIHFPSSPYDLLGDMYYSWAFPEMPDLREMEPDRFYAPATLPLIIETIRNELAKHNMLGRVSSGAVSSSAMFTRIAVEYAMKRMNGNAPADGIDTTILEQLMLDYISETTGMEGLGVALTPFTHEGETYQNFIAVFTDYMIY
jgi:hypothetical protein